MNSKLPEIGNTVLYEGEQFIVTEADHESDVYCIDNDNYVGYALLSELTLVENVTTNSEFAESEQEQATAYFEPKTGDTLLS